MNFHWKCSEINTWTSPGAVTETLLSSLKPSGERRRTCRGEASALCVSPHLRGFELLILRGSCWEGGESDNFTYEYWWKHLSRTGGKRVQIMDYTSPSGIFIMTGTNTWDFPPHIYNISKIQNYKCCCLKSSRHLVKPSDLPVKIKVLRAIKMSISSCWTSPLLTCNDIKGLTTHRPCTQLLSREQGISAGIFSH